MTDLNELCFGGTFTLLLLVFYRTECWCPRWLAGDGFVERHSYSIDKSASFTLFYNDDKSAFETLVRRYKQHLAANITTYFDVYPPNEWETIRGGPGMFMSLHPIENSTRFESVNGNEPPRKQGSTLGAKFVLQANPPSPIGDLNLLPWE